MISNYTNIHLPQYPCVSEQHLSDAVSRVLMVHNGDTDAALSLGIPASSGLTHYDYFIVFIVLAVSSLTLTWKNEHQARTASDAFFDTALRHLRLAPEVTDIHRLQTYLLLAHYANLNPNKADNWICIWNATRIVLDLGLHKQASEVLLQDDQEEVRFRNKLFWCTYGMERSLSGTVRLPLAFPEEASITISHDTNSDEDTKYSSASHLYRFRVLETEVHRTLYLQDNLTHASRTDLNAWMVDIIYRLDAWLERAKDFSKYQMLEFRMVQYGLLKARLFRPSPRLESRTPKERENCFDACSILVEDYQRQTKSRRLFYPWHGVHNLFEAASIMLESCWALRDYGHLTHRSRHILAVTLPDCLALLNKVGESWQDATLCSVYLNPILEDVTRAYSDRALAQIDAARIAAESLTTEKLRKLVFPEGPLLWESRIPSEIVQNSTADPTPPLEPVMSSMEDVDWDAFWEYVQELSPIWTDIQPSDAVTLSA
jgi:Fungal specific transcription factor domain